MYQTIQMHRFKIKKRSRPLVQDRSNYLLGPLAKESAMLALLSGGRFELGLGAGDYPAEQEAWGQPLCP